MPASMFVHLPGEMILFTDSWHSHCAITPKDFRVSNSYNTPGLPDANNRSVAIEVADVSALLRVTGEVSCVRNDPRQWRLALLAGLNHLLPAAASAAYIFKPTLDTQGVELLSHFDCGFKNHSHQQAYLAEFHDAPFRDPLSAALLAKLSEKFPGQRTFTAIRSDLIGDQAWAGSSHVKQYRNDSDLGDCVVSLHRSSERAYTMAICCYRSQKDPARFTPRDRILLHTLHASLDWIYRAEESSQRVNLASALSPRLRQTLERLLAGETERQVSRKMNISVHTVHDYVKMLYTHFGVSSRSELVARCMRDTGQSPQPPFPK